MKRFFEINFSGEPYDAVAKRKGQDLFYILGGDKVAKPAAGPVPKQIQPKTFTPKVSTTSQPKTSISASTSHTKSSVGGGVASKKVSTVASAGSDSELTK